jgi:hypothetical protein
MKASGWSNPKQSGWLTFSGVVLLFTGIMRVFDAIWAFIYDGPVVNDLHNALFGHSLTTYGVVWLIVGAILIFAGIFILSPVGVTTQVARWVGIVAAAIAAVTAVTWMPYYPVWALIYIGIAVIVIYGLAARFEEEAVTQGS